MHRKLPLHPIVCQTIPTNILSPFIFTIRFNIIPQYRLTYFMFYVSYGLLVHAYVNKAIRFLTAMTEYIIYQSVCLSVCLSVYLSVYLSVCLSIKSLCLSQQCLCRSKTVPSARNWITEGLQPHFLHHFLSLGTRRTSHYLLRRNDNFICLQFPVQPVYPWPTKPIPRWRPCGHPNYDPLGSPQRQRKDSRI